MSVCTSSPGATSTPRQDRSESGVADLLDAEGNASGVRMMRSEQTPFAMRFARAKEKSLRETELHLLTGGFPRMGDVEK
jgi:hypothetical protein